MGYRRNLLKETEEALRIRGYDWDDVVSIQGSDHRISVDKFKELADQVYDAGYGGQEVACDLVMLLRDGSWFSRGEYDGSEWWEHHARVAVIPEISDERIRTLFAKIGWDSLATCNGLVSVASDWHGEKEIEND